MQNKRYNDNPGPDYTYTAAGRLKTRTWARNLTTTYTTNSLGEVSAINYSDGLTSVTFQYDRQGRRTNVVDAAGTHFLDFDLGGHLLAERHTSGVLAGLSVTNAYNALGLRTASALDTQVSTLTIFGYDAASRLNAVTNGSATVV